jgi:CDP-glucose 4,6-dehydratase
MSDNSGSATMSFWSTKRVLITGATGMVGAWMVKDLVEQGAYVVVLVRDANPQSELFRSGDIENVSVVSGTLEDLWSLERAINKHEIDTVFHLGAQTIVGTAHRFPLPTFEANIRGTYNLLEACRLHRHLVQRVVVASSDKAYGEQEVLPYTEDMPLEGQHPYEVSKSCVDLITQSYAGTYGLPVSIVRCGNIFGGGDLNWSRIVPGAIRAFLHDEKFELRSDGSFKRDYIYVKDVVEAYMQIAERLDEETIRGEAFNFSFEQPLTVLELVRTIQEMIKAEHAEIVILNRAEGEIRNQYLSAAKARSILKWQPQYSFERALEETIEWYRGFFEK